MEGAFKIKEKRENKEMPATRAGRTISSNYQKEILGHVTGQNRASRGHFKSRGEGELPREATCKEATTNTVLTIPMNLQENETQIGGRRKGLGQHWKVALHRRHGG